MEWNSISETEVGEVLRTTLNWRAPGRDQTTTFGDRSVIKKGTENILKYRDLLTQIQRMWNVKANVLPVIRGATGSISKSLR